MVSNMDYKKILDKVNKKNIVPRFIVLMIGTFLLAFTYTTFLLPNNIITGGVSGLGVIAKHLFGFNPATFILIVNILLIAISFIFLGKEKTMRTIVGSLMYPIFIELVTPLSNRIIPYLEFDNFIIPLIIMTLLYGISCGIVYKTGFTTGGSDILMQIANKYLRISLGKATLITSLILLACGGFTFGVEKLIYSICVIYISTLIIDRINIGISDSKMFFIYTKKTSEIQNYIIEKMNTGVTLIEAQGGLSKERKPMIMCVVATKDYFLFKETLRIIDPNAFFVISDCYEVSGGVKRNNLPVSINEEK